MPTYNTSDRYGLRALSPGTQPGSGIDEGFVALRDDVSAKLAPFDAGTRSSRPRSTPGVPGIAGRTYRSADGGVDLDLGTSWVTLKPGSFAVLPTLSGNASDGLDEGMEILFQTAAMATALVGPWRLRYDSTLSGTSKWKVLAADPWYAGGGDATAVAATSASPTWGDFSDVGPTIALPVLGDYVIRFGAALTCGGTTPDAMNVTPVATGLTPSIANMISCWNTAATAAVDLGGLSSTVKAAGISGTLKLQHTKSGTGSAKRRYVEAVPLRLG